MAGSNDFSLEMLHHASVMAQTKISFPKKQLLQLIQGYLSRVGLHESASVLRREADLDLMMTPNSKLMLHRSVPPMPQPQSGASSSSLLTPVTANGVNSSNSSSRLSASATRALVSKILALRKLVEETL